MKNCYLVIIDGLGVGAQEDAADYGDVGMNTLGNVSKQTGVKLPNLANMGIGNIIPLTTIPETSNPTAAFGKMREVSGGKDSTTGHWEIAGVQLDKPFPTYPNGFPVDVINEFCKEIGVEAALCNLPYSGTDVIRDYGEEHQKTGNPIVYTSADSVFQIATHDSVTSVEKLYEWCEIARNKICAGEHEVGRVIARPFSGKSGDFFRLTNQRKDFSAIPPKNNIVQTAFEAGIRTYSIGKIIDLFASKGFSDYRKTENNAQGIKTLLDVMNEVQNSFVFVNLIDTDQLFGHRLDPEGFAGSLKEFDDALPKILAKIDEDDILIITGDHGNDPCSTSTDHSREFVPLLVYPMHHNETINLGTRDTFADVASSIAAFFGLEDTFPGKSFLH